MRGSSSGLLIYAAIVDLLAEDFLSEKAQAELMGKEKWWGVFWVLMGGGLSLGSGGSGLGWKLMFGSTRNGCCWGVRIGGGYLCTLGEWEDIAISICWDLDRHSLID